MASMIEIHEVFEIYRTKRVDIIPFLSTFIVSLLFGLEFGILAGIAVNFIMTLYTTSRPKIDFEVERINDVDVLIITPDQSLNYSSAEYFKSAVIKRTTREFSSMPYIFINGVSINNSVDVTVVKVSAFSINNY
jgi:solute carrier family 26 (sodium-independent sulfate anion transporter), member 11